MGGDTRGSNRAAVLSELLRVLPNLECEVDERDDYSNPSKEVAQISKILEPLAFLRSTNKLPNTESARKAADDLGMVLRVDGVIEEVL